MIIILPVLVAGVTVQHYSSAVQSPAVEPVAAAPTVADAATVNAAESAAAYLPGHRGPESLAGPGPTSVGLGLTSVGPA